MTAGLPSEAEIVLIPREAGSVVPVNVAPNDALIMDEAREEEARVHFTSFRSCLNIGRGQPRHRRRRVHPYSLR